MKQVITRFDFAMMDEKVITAIYESHDSIAKLHKLTGLPERKILLIRLGKLYGKVTENLFPGIQSKSKGRQGKPKLEKVEIEYILQSDDSYRELGELFGVGKDTIFDVKNGVTWKDFNRECVVPSRRKIFAGESAPRAKLTDVKVKEILSKVNDCTIAQLAKEYGVDSGTISAIRRGETWKYLKRPDIKPNNKLKGFEHHNSRLTEDQAKEATSSTLTGVELARKFGVHPSTVTRVRRRYEESKRYENVHRRRIETEDHTFHVQNDTG